VDPSRTTSSGAFWVEQLININRNKPKARKAFIILSIHRYKLL
jgi:hypothetical protein